MFKNLTGFAQMLRSASSLSQKIQEIKERLARETATGSAGGNLVHVEMSGDGRVKLVKLAPELVAGNNVASIEELISVAMNEALAKVRKMHIDMMKEATGGIDIPGLDSALSSL